MLEDWTAALLAELDLTTDVDVAALLDLARDAAHNVARPAAPLTTFLVGLAAGRAGATPADIQSAIDTARTLAQGWSPAQP
jgi:hypothetical protein